VTKRISFVALLLAAIALLTTSCGTSDYLESLTLSSNGAAAGGFYNLAGVDGTLQLVVTANYHSGKMIDVTNNSTFAMVPTGTIYSTADGTYPAGGPLPAPGPNTVTVNTTGLMTGIAQICTWVDATTTTNGVTTPDNPAEWEYTGYYQVTATYRNFTSQPVGIGMGIAVSNTAGCGPS
jgi:hypothetical protein